MAISGDIFANICKEEDTAVIWWVEVTDVAKKPRMHRTAHLNKRSSAENVSGAELRAVPF